MIIATEIRDDIARKVAAYSLLRGVHTIYVIDRLLDAALFLLEQQEIGNKILIEDNNSGKMKWFAYDGILNFKK